jgi:CubicO group peptidase (beta-lactamase class C family)
VTDPPHGVVELLAETAERRQSAVIGTVVEGNELAWTADASGGDEALFQAGSLSKTVTAAVALELVGRDELELDREVRGTTLRDLLSHTAGANVPFYPGYPQGKPVPTLAQSLEGGKG